MPAAWLDGAAGITGVEAGEGVVEATGVCAAKGLMGTPCALLVAESVGEGALTGAANGLTTGDAVRKGSMG